MNRIILLLCLGAAALPAQTIAKFSDPARPGFLKLHQANGNITVTGYEGKEVVINSKIKVITREEGNRMTITADPNFSLTLQVPYQTALQLNATNGSILVEKVQGEIDAQSTNGKIVVRGAASAVVAHSTNGSINVTFDKVDTRRPMSFSSMNGKIEVTFPADLKAALIAKSQRGSVHSDFDMSASGTPEIQFKSYNGGVYIHKAR